MKTFKAIGFKNFYKKNSEVKSQYPRGLEVTHVLEKPLLIGYYSDFWKYEPSHFLAKIVLMDYSRRRLSKHVAPHTWNNISSILQNIRSDLKPKCSIWESCHPRQNTPGCSIFSKGWIRVLPPSLSCFFYLFCLWVLKHTTNGPTAQSLITHCWTLHSHWGQCKRQEDTYMHIAQHEKMPRNPKMLSSGLWSWCNDHASYIEDTKSHCNKIVTRDGFIALALALALALYKFIWSPLREFRLYKYKLLAWCPSLNLQQVYSAHHRTKLGGSALFYMSGQMAEWCVAVWVCPDDNSIGRPGFRENKMQYGGSWRSACSYKSLHSTPKTMTRHHHNNKLSSY